MQLMSALCDSSGGSYQRDDHTIKVVEEGEEIEGQFDPAFSLAVV